MRLPAAPGSSVYEKLQDNQNIQASIAQASFVEIRTKAARAKGAYFKSRKYPPGGKEKENHEHYHL